MRKVSQTKYKEILLDLTDEEFLKIARLAHKNDITFNQMVNQILREEMEKAIKLAKANFEIDKVTKSKRKKLGS